jgi:hypothetical protein
VIDGEAEIMGSLSGVGSVMPPVDSIVFDDCRVSVLPMITEGLFGYWFEASEGQLTGYRSGDIADLRIYTPSGTCTCAPVLLDWNEDCPKVQDWNLEDADTVDTETSITVTWHPVLNADWYLFITIYNFDSLGIAVAQSVYFTGTNDTTITRPGSAIPYDGWLDIGVIAVTGPALDATAGNVSCNTVGGSIHSWAIQDFQVCVGAGCLGFMSPADRGFWQGISLNNMLQKLMR